MSDTDQNMSEHANSSHKYMLNAHHQALYAKNYQVLKLNPTLFKIEFYLHVGIFIDLHFIYMLVFS